MSKVIRVLVDGMGGDVGQGVAKCLRDSVLNIEIFISCISDQSAWLYKFENSFIFPFVSDDKFEGYLIDFLNKHQIDVFFPTVDSTLLKISGLKHKIESATCCKVFIDDLEKIKICDNKLLTHQFLLDNDFDSPDTLSMAGGNVSDLVTKIGLPLIVKPCSGNGSKDIFRINDAEDLSKFIGRKDFICQSLLDIQDGEITCGIYLGDDKKVKGIYTLKRVLKNGSTHHAERIIDDVLEGKLIAIAMKMGMKYINIQAVYKNNKLLPFEFNGRLSGTSGVMRSVFNAPEIFIRERILNEVVTPSNNREKIFFTRYNEEVIYTVAEKESLIVRSKNDH